MEEAGEGPDGKVTAQARAIDRIFEILIVGAKPHHSGQAAGAKTVRAHVTCARQDVFQKNMSHSLFLSKMESFLATEEGKVC